MDEFFWRYILLIPIGTGVIIGASIVIILYDIIRPKLAKVASQFSVTTSQSRINEIKNQIAEIEKYKNDHKFLVKVILREILWAFRNVFVTCIAIVIYYLLESIAIVLISRYATTYLHLFEFTRVTLKYVAIIFFWYHFSRSLKRVLIYYQLVKHVVNYSNYKKEKATEVIHLKQTIKKISKAKRFQST